MQYDGSTSWMVEYTCNKSSASGMRFSGPTGGNSTKSFAHQRSTFNHYTRDRLGCRLTLRKVFVGHGCWSGQKITGTEREGSEPPLTLHGRCIHGLVRAAWQSQYTGDGQRLRSWGHNQRVSKLAIPLPTRFSERSEPTRTLWSLFCQQKGCRRNS